MTMGFAKGITRFILADVAAQGASTGLSGLTLFGKTFIAGKGVGKVLCKSMSVFNIISGLWQIRDGVSDINASKHATAYRDAAEKIDESTNQYQEVLQEIARMFGVTSSDSKI